MKSCDGSYAILLHIWGVYPFSDVAPVDTHARADGRFEARCSGRKSPNHAMNDDMRADNPLLWQQMKLLLVIFYTLL